MIEMVYNLQSNLRCIMHHARILACRGDQAPGRCHFFFSINFSLRFIAFDYNAHFRPSHISVRCIRFNPKFIRFISLMPDSHYQHISLPLHLPPFLSTKTRIFREWINFSCSIRWTGDKESLAFRRGTYTNTDDFGNSIWESNTPRRLGHKLPT